MFGKLAFQVQAGLLGEDVADMAGEVVLDAIAVCQSSNLSRGHVHGGNDHDNVAAHGGDVQVHGGTHQLGNVDDAVDAGAFQGDMLGTDAQNDVLLSNVVGSQALLLLFAKLWYFQRTRRISDVCYCSSSVYYSE